MDFEVTVQAGLRRPYENVPAGSIRPFLSLNGKAGAAGNAPVFRILTAGFCLTTGNNPLSSILTVENCLLLRATI